MKLEDLNRILNRKLEKEGIIDSKSLITIKRSIIPDKKFKAYKDYEISLWYINIETKVHKAIISEHITRRSVTDKEEEWAINDIEFQFMERLLNVINTEEFKELIYGKEQNL